MGYEVDIIGVGKESQSGDAITLRWGGLFGARNQQKVVIIDGGFQATGQDVVDHIKRYYQTRLIDAVVSTHPDQDHVNGLHIILDELEVKELWIHKPWEHNQRLAEKFVDGRITDNSIGQRLRQSLGSASDLVDKAQRKNIRIVEPFAGISLFCQNEFRVLGPTQSYYESLIPEFDGMPKANLTFSDLIAEIAGRKAWTKRLVTSRWGIDSLGDEDTTSAKNNSSAITAITVEGHRLLFTADAGITALSFAANHLDPNWHGADFRLIQIPHHGSRRNIGPTILNRIIGYPLPRGQKRNICAIASTSAKGEPKHPRKAVMNAFTHRGVSASATRGNTRRFAHNAPLRKGWASAEPDDYYWNYEDDE